MRPPWLFLCRPQWTGDLNSLSLTEKIKLHLVSHWKNTVAMNWVFISPWNLCSNVISNWTMLGGVVLVKKLDDRNGHLKRWAISDSPEVLASISIRLNVERPPGDETRSFQNDVPGSDLPLLPASQGSWVTLHVELACLHLLSFWIGGSVRVGLLPSSCPEYCMLKQMKVLAKGSPMHTTWCVSQKDSPLELRCWSFPQHLHRPHLGCVELHRLLEALACSITEGSQEELFAPNLENCSWRFGGGKPACYMQRCMSAALLCKGRALRNKRKRGLI